MSSVLKSKAVGSMLDSRMMRPSSGEARSRGIKAWAST